MRDPTTAKAGREAVKRRQRARGLCEGAPKWAVVEADAVTHAAEGNIVASEERELDGPNARDDSAGVDEQSTCARVPQEPGKPRRLRLRSVPLNEETK